MASDGREIARRPRAVGSPWRAAILLAFPVSVALLLSAPGFRFPFLFDDFELLARAQAPGWAKFLPDPAALFYRPVAREGYFGLLLALGGGESALLGHVLNFALAVIAVVLLYAAMARLLGRTAGLTAAFLLASFGQLPILTAWVSGCQDLLAVDFLLGALLFELSERHAAALVAATLALLSKETSIALFPVLAASRWVLGYERRPSTVVALAYLGVMALWAGIHPGLRHLAGGGFMQTEAGYLGLDNPERLVSFLRGGAVLFNLPPPGTGPVWPANLTLPAILALAAIAGGWGLASRDRAASESRVVPGGRVALLGLALAVLPLILTSAVVRHWAPYYVAIPAIGGCILVTALLEAAPREVVPAALCVFMALGVWVRGMRVDPEIPTEANLYPASQALETVADQFKRLAPSFPDSAQVLVTVLARGERSVRVHIYRYQAPRWWYRNRTLEVTRPELRTGSRRPEFLFWIGQDLAVYEVDLRTLRPRSLGPRAEYLDYQKVLRGYVRGLADSGELRGAVWILLHMPELREEYRNLDHRIAAMLLLDHGYGEEAAKLLAPLPPISPQDALRLVPVFLETPSRRGLGLAAAMQAFGLSPDDVGTVRQILATLRTDHAYPQVRAAAQHLMSLRPGDGEAQAALEEAARGHPVDLLIAPVP